MSLKEVLEKEERHNILNEGTLIMEKLLADPWDDDEEDDWDGEEEKEEEDADDDWFDLDDFDDE